MQTESRLKDIYLLSIPSSDYTEEKTNNPTTLERTQDQQETITHLESLTLAHIDAVNTRNLDLNSTPWTLLSPTFVGDVRSVCQKSPRTYNRTEYLAEYRWLTMISPEYHLEVTSVSTELKGRGRGEVTLRLENRGNPVGVVRVLVVMIGWRKEGEGWVCEEVRAVRGPEV